MSYQIIQSSMQLDEVCRHLSSHSRPLMLDTEFVRTRTYYAKLGLLQVFDDEHCFLIDPIELDLDKTDFWQILSRHDWVLHAFGEDLEILKLHVEQFGTSVFDTQIGAAVLGWGPSLGYQAIIEQTTGILLDKGESRTDWVARPLTTSQLKYAANDVIYLQQAYFQIIEQLQARGLYEIALEECQRLAHQRCAPIDADNAYRDIKNAWRLSRQQLAVLKLLAKWRIETAIARDMPVNNVVKTDVLWAIAKFQPTTKTALKATGISPQALRIHEETLIAIVEQAQMLDEAQWPAKLKRMIDYPNYRSSLDQFREAMAIAETETTIPADILAPKRLIHELFKWHWQLDEHQRKNVEKPTLISGWREKVLKDYLPAL
ncbi:ribonuclease D [Celerinatantimonas sp. YJH-8]|uniref:ribonuclease D n=1 Tax=Celerinatantimonas sp. YJH-8 TaxID=3228714 RepID=UPI0038C11B4F